MKKSIPLFCISLVFGVLALSTAANAAIDAAGATALKKDVETELQWRKDRSRLGGQDLTSGDVQVTPKGDYYEVQIPGITAGFGKQRKLLIGTVTINATPGKNPGEWQTKTSLPAKLTLADMDNKTVGTVTVGNQSATALWIPAKGLFPQMNIAYGDIRIEGAAPDAFFGKIASFALASNLKDNGDGTWSGPTQMGIDNLQFRDSNNGVTTVEIRHIGADGTYDKLNPAQSVEMRKKIGEMAQAGGDPKAAQAKILLTNAQGIFENFVSKASIDGIKVQHTPAQPVPENTQAPKKPEQKVTTLALEKLIFNNSLLAATQEKSTVTINLGFKGLKVAPMPSEMEGIIPEAFNADITVFNMPLRKLSEAVLTMLNKKPEPGQPNPLLDIIYKAGTHVVIKDTYVKAPQLSTLLEGRVKADEKAVMGMTSHTTVSITGLENAIARLRTAAAKPGASPQLANVANNLTALMMLGQKDSLPGQPAIYVFELTQDGRMLFNGVNVQLLMNAGKILNDRMQQNQKSPQPPPKSTPAPVSPPI